MPKYRNTGPLPSALERFNAPMLRLLRYDALCLIGLRDSLFLGFCSLPVAREP